MSIKTPDDITTYEQTPDSINPLETQKKDEVLPSTLPSESDKKEIAEQEKADKLKIQEIRESLGLFEMKPVVKQQHVSEAIQEVMLDDLRSRSEQGPYTQMRRKFSETYGFDYDSLVSQVHTKLEQDVAPAEVEKFAKDQLQTLTEQIWEDRKTDLEKWSALLHESIGQNHETFHSIRSSLTKFYGNEFQSKSFSLKLVPHPQEKENFAIPSTEQIGEVTLYVPRIDSVSTETRKTAAEDLIVDSFHELSHQQLQTESFSELAESAKQTDEYKQVLDMYCEGQSPFYDFTKEAVTNYVDAYVRQAQFHREKTKAQEHTRDVYTMGTWINTDLANEYFSQGKQIDLEFIKRLFQIMQE